MGAVRMVLRAEARFRWRPWLALALLVALVSGAAMAATTAGRRTATAYPRFVHAYGFDTLVYAFKPTPGIATLPGVTASSLVTLAGTGVPRCACAPINPNSFDVSVGPSTGAPTLKLVAGRMPTRSSTTEVLASFSLEQQGVHIGTVIRVPFDARSQTSQVLNDPVSPVPKGPTLTFKVVGIEASQFEFPSIGSPYESLYTTSAFAQRYSSQLVHFYLYFVRLRHGAADQAALQVTSSKLGVAGVSDQDTASSEVEGSIHPQAVGWWILAVLAAVAGLLTIGQAFARQTRVVRETYPVLSALGVDTSELAWVNIGRAAAVALGGAGLGVLLAILLSPLTPVGEARYADPSSGLYVDPSVLGLGVLVTIVSTVLVALWPALRSARLRPGGPTAPRRTSTIVTALSGAGAPPSTVIGVRRALERGHGRDAVPVASALVGTAVAVLALVATVVFGASLSHLTATPSLYGQEFDAWMAGLPAQHQLVMGPVLSQLRADPAITAITLGASDELSINHHEVDAIAGQAVRGSVLLRSVDGRLPQRPDEVALGASTLRQVGGRLGGDVRVAVTGASGGTRTSTFRVVGTVSFPTDFGVGGLGNGAIFTIAGLASAQCPSGPAARDCLPATESNDEQVILFAGSAGAVAHFAHKYQNIVSLPLPPNNLVNFGEAVNFPLIIGLVLALFGAATLLHTLVVSATRRRPETGLLKALGFVRSQLAAAVAWQATAIALVGLVVGVPLGIVVGNAAWRLFANDLGVYPDTVVLAGAIAAVAGGVVLLANLLAIAPAVISSRLVPAQLLRAQ